MGKRWRLEKNIDGKWYLEGTYGENFIPQMGAAYANLARQGFEPYKEIRIVEVENKND